MIHHLRRAPLPHCRAGATLARVGALSLLFSGAAVGQQPKTLPVFTDGQAQVVPGFQDPEQWIRQGLWVETEVDSDGDGKRDRVHVDVIRPRQTEAEGLKVPVVYESSPYFAGLRDAQYWDVKQELGATPPHRDALPAAPVPDPQALISNSYAETWVPRGFAVVHSESPGTGQSQGCPTIGGANESLAPKAVVDWLNGRARGFTTADGNDTVVASWSTGKVGMVGVSYNGILALAAATTGVAGLEAIIPISPVSSWYEYYRSNGLVRSPGGYLGEDMDVMFDAINNGPRSGYCAAAVRDSVLSAGADRVTGDYNDFWASRDYLAKASQIKAAVFVGHGFGDWNTMPEQGVRIYEALKQRHVPVHAYFNQGGHGATPPMMLMNRWFTHYLYGVGNGVEKEPPVWIAGEGDDGEHPTSYADYPNPATAPVTLHLRSGGDGVGGLATTGSAGQGKETLVDDVNATKNAAVLAWTEHEHHRLLYATPALTESVHLSGRPSVTIRLAANKPAANLSIYLIALPPTRDSASTVTVITRGWADPQNSQSLAHGAPLVPGQFYTLHFNLQPQDQVILAGARIALMIFSSSEGFTLWPTPGTELTVDLDGTSVTLPIVGGAGALKTAKP